MEPKKPATSSPPSHGGDNNTIRAAIMAVVVVVFSGYLFMWVIASTNVYKLTWLPQIRAKTISTYFGTNQGTTSYIYHFCSKLIIFIVL